MDISWQTFGHDRLKNLLEKQLQAGRLPHAYLFLGPEGIGKKSLALEMVKKILETESLNNHPDFQILDTEEEITMELTQDFISRLSFKPFLATKKVAIINNAENFNAQSGNSLLKTLEEPSPSTILILIASSQSLLPTIVSRCQVLHFNAFNKDELIKFTESKGIKANGEILDLSFGRPGRLKKLADNKEFLAKELAKIEEYRRLSQQTLGEKLIAITALAEGENNELRENLTTWLIWQKNRLANEPSDYGKVRALANSMQGLGMNKNKKMVLQELMLSL